MRRAHLLQGAGLALAVALLLMLSNPAPAAHEATLRAAAPTDLPVIEVRGVAVVGGRVLRYRNLLIGSYSTVAGRMVTWGLLGSVWANAPALEALRARAASLEES